MLIELPVIERRHGSVEGPKEVRINHVFNTDYIIHIENFTDNSCFMHYKDRVEPYIVGLYYEQLVKVLNNNGLLV